MVLFAIRFGNEQEKVSAYVARMKEKFGTGASTNPKDLGLLFLRGQLREYERGLVVVDISPSMPPAFLIMPIISIAFFLFGVTAVLPHLILWFVFVFGALWYWSYWYILLLRIGYKRIMKEPAEVTQVTQRRLLSYVVFGEGFDEPE